MKKLLLSLGAISLLTLPVLTIVSCSSAKPKNLNITITINTGLTQEKIDTVATAVSVYEKSEKTDSNKDMYITALKGIFTGITKETLSNINITVLPVNIGYNQEILITTNKGYVIDGNLPNIKATMGANITRIETQTKLVITKNKMDKAITAIEKYNSSEKTDVDKKTFVDALNLNIFNGIVERDLDSFIITANKTVTNKPTIIITGKDLFTISGNPSITAGVGNTVDIIVTFKATMIIADSIKSVENAITRWKGIIEKGTPPTRLQEVFFLTSLTTLFTGLTIDNLYQMDYTFISDPINPTVTLTAIDGYTLSGEATLTAIVQGVNLGIFIIAGTHNSATINAVIAAIRLFDTEQNPNGVVLAQKLSSIFDRVFGLNIGFIKATFTEKSGSEAVTLTVKGTGYTLNGTDTTLTVTAA